MLGTLAKWLRILGFDTFYVRDMKDEDITAIAKEEGRVLLTRDKELFFKTMNAVYIESDKLQQQLNEVISKTGIKIDDEKILSRCTVCNEMVKKIDKEKVKGKVPKHVYENHEEFYICPRCGRIYWIGTHYDNIEKFVEALKVSLS